MTSKHLEKITRGPQFEARSIIRRVELKQACRANINWSTDHTSIRIWVTNFVFWHGLTPASPIFARENQTPPSLTVGPIDT